MGLQGTPCVEVGFDVGSGAMSWERLDYAHNSDSDANKVCFLFLN